MTDARLQKLRLLSDRLVAAQRPIRVLDGVQWPADVEDRFLAADGRELPHVSPTSYRPLRFNPVAKRAELAAIERESHVIGGPAAALLALRCRHYRRAVRLLERRGSADFAASSLTVYGQPTAAEDRCVREYLAALERTLSPEPNGVELPASVAAQQFAARLRQWLPAGAIARVVLCDGLLSDAAAGRSYVKLRRGATFAASDLDLLEVHEGWVHLGTTHNGRTQPICTFLAHGPPATSCAQEGLAVLCELLAGVSHAGRVRRLANRFEAVRRAAAGADFRAVYRFFLAESDDRHGSYQMAARVFRGCPADRGPFAKDFGYGLGLVRILHAIGDRRDPFDVATFFAGKLALDERPLLAAAFADGTVSRPSFVPSIVLPCALVRRLAELPHVGHARRAPLGFGESRRVPLSLAGSNR